MIYWKLKDPVVRINSSFLKAWSQSSTAFLALLEQELSTLHDQLSEVVRTLMWSKQMKQERTGK